MAHNIMKNDNMFSVRETPWHGLGEVIQEAPSISEGIRLANLDWEVSLAPLQTVGDQRAVKHKAVVRSDTNDILAVVGPDWTPLQNIDAFNFFDKFLDSGAATLETAGSLKNGEIVWVLAKIANQTVEIAKNDPIERYMLLSNGHNGLLAVKVGFTTTRVVCNNTLNIAHNSQASKLIRIKHSSRVKENVDNVKMIMDVANQEFVANVEQMRRLVNKDINQKDVEKYVKLTFFQHKDLSSDKVQGNYRKMLTTFERLIWTGAGHDIKNVKGTAWGLYNAATEYITHELGRTPESRLNSLWFGSNAKLNDTAFQNIMALVA